MARWLQSFFAFSTWERNTIVLLCLVLLAAYAWPFAKPFLWGADSAVDAHLITEAKAFAKTYEAYLAAHPDTAGATDSLPEYFNPFEGEKIHKRYLSSAQPVMFQFDPNTATEDDWIKLGLSPKEAKGVENLKAAGFRFDEPEDMQRVRAIRPDHYERLKPYIRIAQRTKPAGFSELHTKPTTTKLFTIDINAADSSMWERQRGIGPRLAQRIVNYRTRLGGFLRPQQVAEVWGLPDSTFRALLPKMAVADDATPMRLDLNSADVKTLGRHPYINFPVARAIEAYRKEHGPFASVAGLRQLPIVSDSLFRLMEPYLEVK